MEYEHLSNETRREKINSRLTDVEAQHCEAKLNLKQGFGTQERVDELEKLIEDLRSDRDKLKD